MKEYEFKVSFGEGRYANGTVTIKADSESEAYDLALNYICGKLANAFPELDIEVSIELA